jgi:FMN phosphatase YigB (HAD superfamily)
VSFIFLIKKYNLSLTETLAVGDRKLDIEAAKRAGIKTFHLHNECENYIKISDYHGSSLKDLLELI